MGPQLLKSASTDCNATLGRGFSLDMSFIQRAVWPLTIIPSREDYDHFWLFVDKFIDLLCAVGVMGLSGQN